MKIVRTSPIDAKIERQILIALIMNDAVCLSVFKSYKPEYFQTKMTKEVSKWCFEFFTKYDSAPKQDISTIFETKTKSGKIDPDLGDEIEVFLVSLDEEYQNSEEVNSQFYVDMCFSYFKKRSYNLFAHKIQTAVEEDKLEEAEQLYANFTKVQEKQDLSRNILTEEGIEAFRASMETRNRVLFTMPGALGKMIGPIERETLIGLLGREKIGKTYVLQVFAKAAAKSGLRVAFIQTGDLTHDQLDIRLSGDLANGTYKEENVGTYFAPIMDCIKNQMGVCQKHPSKAIAAKGKENTVFIVDTTDSNELRTHKPCIQCYKDLQLRPKFKGSIWWEEKEVEQWNWGQLKKKAKQFKKWYGGDIITAAFNMQTVKISDIRNWILQKQQQDNWIPDVLLVDGPDIALAEDKMEFRHGENQKWMILRQISQEFHTCVIAVTQANSKSYGKDTLKLENFSEDKRKYAHCTHFYAINKSETEEKCGVFRLGALILREDSAKIVKQVSVIQDLRVNKPYISSFYGRIPDIIGLKDK